MAENKENQSSRDKLSQLNDNDSDYLDNLMSSFMDDSSEPEEDLLSEDEEPSSNEINYEEVEYEEDDLGVPEESSDNYDDYSDEYEEYYEDEYEIEDEEYYEYKEEDEYLEEEEDTSITSDASDRMALLFRKLQNDRKKRAQEEEIEEEYEEENDNEVVDEVQVAPEEEYDSFIDSESYEEDSREDTEYIYDNDKQLDYNKSEENYEDDTIDEVVAGNNTEENNSFDDMFDDLTQDEHLEDLVDLGSQEEDLDDQSAEPIEKPSEGNKSAQVKVTQDGRTLEEMLAGKPRKNTVADHVNQVKGDDKFREHEKVVKKKREEQDKRRALSKKFIQKNSTMTEQEKIILENLGVTGSQFTDLMKSRTLTQKQKEDIIGLGRYGAEKHFKGRRYRTTVGDTTLLEFLTKFKFANTRVLRWISNEPQGRTWRKLNRLLENGLVESKSIIGIPDLWGATPAGIGISGYDLKPGLRPFPKIGTISSDTGVNYIAACLWFNTVNVLNLPDFPAKNREIAAKVNGENWVRGEELVSELEIRSSLGVEINPHSTTQQTLGDERLYDVISANVANEFSKWEASGKQGDSPESLPGNEYMWILFPTSQLTLSYHVPDLVVKRRRGPNGEPRSIAVEMERYPKSNDRYDKIMLAYKLDEHLYDKVIWITPNTRVAKRLEQAAKSVGFKDYNIIPIITEDGVYNKTDIWMI